MAINWELGRIDPNQATNTLAAFQAGRQQRQQVLRENALRTYAQGGGVNDLIAADPQLGMQARQYDQQQQVATATRRRETEARHMQGTIQVLTGARSVPEADRAAYIANQIRTRRDIWEDPAEAEQAAAAIAGNPNARFDDAHLDAIITGSGGNPNEGAYNLGRGERRFRPGSSTPIAEGLPPEPPRPLVVTTPQNGSSTIYGDLSQYGGNRTDLGAPSVTGTPASAATAPGRPIAGASGPMWNQVVAAVAPLNPTPAEMTFLGQTFQAESSGGRNQARNGSSQGGFQFHPDTFRGVMPNGNIGRLNDQAQAALTLARQNEAAFQQQFNREPTAGELYLMHQQGTPGALALMNAPPEVNAIAALTPAYRGNARLARQAIVNNGGSPDMTAGEFVQHWRGRFDGGGAGAQQTASTGSPNGPRHNPDGSTTITGPPRPQGRYNTPAENAAQGLPRTAVVFTPPNGTPQRLDRASDHPQADGAPPLDDNDLTYAAGIYAQTGQMPPLGQGRAASALRAQIVHRARQISDETGQTGPEAARLWQENRAAAATLRQVQTRRAFLEQQANEARGAGQLMLQGMPDGQNGTQPWLNRPYREFLSQTGNAGVSRFNIAVNTFGEIYARVMTGATGAAAATDSARQRAHELLNPNQSPQQIRANYQQMLSEMAVQSQALDAAEQAARAQIRTAPGGRGGGGPPVTAEELAGVGISAAQNASARRPPAGGPRPAPTAQRPPAATPRPAQATSAAPAGYRVIRVR